MWTLFFATIVFIVTFIAVGILDLLDCYRGSLNNTCEFKYLLAGRAHIYWVILFITFSSIIFGFVTVLAKSRSYK